MDSLSDQNQTASTTQTFVQSVQNSVSIPQEKIEEFRKFIEMEVLNIIKSLAEKGEEAPERLQAMAKLTLELIKPGMTLEQLYLNAVKLDDQYSELAPVVVKLMREYEDKYEKKALANVSELIKKGQYDSAQSLVKKVLLFKINS